VDANIKKINELFISQQLKFDNILNNINKLNGLSSSLTEEIEKQFQSFKEIFDSMTEQNSIIENNANLSQLLEESAINFNNESSNLKKIIEKFKI